MLKHSECGCEKCLTFLTTFVTHNTKSKIRKSVASSLIEAFTELFEALNLDTVLVEGKLEVSTRDFIKDLVKMCDEVKSEKDIVNMWHIDQALAQTLFSLFSEVVFGTELDDVLEEYVEENYDSDDLDLSSDSD